MEKNVTSIICYIGLIGWLIDYLAGDKEGAKFHLNQGLVLALFAFIGVIPVIGWLVSVVVFVFAIVGIINACNDQEKALPIIGGIKILK